MLTSEIHKTFKVMMDKNAEAIAFGGCPAFLPAEIDLFLNQAYIEIICNKYTGTNSLKLPFEGSVKRVQDLEQLVKTDKAVTANVEAGTNKLYISNLLDAKDSSIKRMFFVNAVLHWTASGNKPSNATVSIVDHATANRFLETHQNKPWIHTPVATIENNTLYIYIDTALMVAPYTVDITYVKYPKQIDYTTQDVNIDEVPDRIMYEVINRAVLIALENIESKRTETKLNLNNLQE